MLGTVLLHIPSDAPDSCLTVAHCESNTPPMVWPTFKTEHPFQPLEVKEEDARLATLAFGIWVSLDRRRHIEWSWITELCTFILDFLDRVRLLCHLACISADAKMPGVVRIHYYVLGRNISVRGFL